jgi:hypothetical protein
VQQRSVCHGIPDSLPCAGDSARDEWTALSGSLATLPTASPSPPTPPTLQSATAPPRPKDGPQRAPREPRGCWVLIGVLWAAERRRPLRPPRAPFCVARPRDGSGGRAQAKGCRGHPADAGKAEPPHLADLRYRKRGPCGGRENRGAGNPSPGSQEPLSKKPVKPLSDYRDRDRVTFARAPVPTRGRRKRRGGSGGGFGSPQRGSLPGG